MRRCSGVLSGVLAVFGALVLIPVAVAPANPAAAAPVSTAVYDSIDNLLPGNVPSVAFQATRTSEFGDVVQLAPGARRLDSVTVTMSSWGCQTGGWSTNDCVTTPGSTFDHPLTLTLYQSDPGSASGVGVVVVSQTQTFAIPYRPSADLLCTGGDLGKWRAPSGTCYNGFATPVTFSFPALPTIPTNLIWTLSYNTTSAGAIPIGTAPCGGNCPYDSLNVGVSSLPNASVGVDVDPSAAVIRTQNSGNNCGATGLDTLRVAAPCWTGNRPMAQIKTLAVSETETTQVVKAVDTSWVFFSESNPIAPASGAYVVGPPVPPLGTGSAQLSVAATTQGQALGKAFLAGTRLDRLTQLSYSSEQPSGSVAPSLQLNVGYTNGNTVYQGRLVYEPTYSIPGGMVPAGWQPWNTLAGKWWATGSLGLGACPQATPCTWSKILQSFPDAQINPNPTFGAVLFKVGAGPAAFTGHVDKLVIGIDDGAGNLAVTNYDFEPTTQCTTTCYVNSLTGDDLNGGTSTTDAKKTIQAAVTEVSSTGTVIVAAGTYVEDVTIPKTLTLQGAGIDQAIVRGPAGGSHATILVQASNVVIDGFTITRVASAATWNDAAPNALNTAGLSVNGGTNSFEVRNSRFVQNRTAIDINNSVGNRVIGNVIQDNRTGMILWNTTDNTTVTGNVIADNWTLGVLFLDGSSGTNVPAQSSANSVFRNNSISGNWYGGVVDRQSGGSIPAPGTTNLKNFSGNWWGTTDPVVTTASSTEPAYTAQIPPPNGSAANPGGAPDIAGVASANVDYTPRLQTGVDTSPSTIGFQGSSAALIATAAGAQVGTASRIQEGITDVDSGGTLRVRAGVYSEPVPATIAKPLSLLGPNVGVSANDAITPLTANPARVSEATLAPLAGAEVLKVGAPAVTIDGLRFTDPATAGASNVSIIGAGGNYGGDASGLVVRNNVFDGITRVALNTNGPTTMTGVTVDHNRVINPTRASGCTPALPTPPSPALSGCGRQLFNLWQFDKSTFTDNVVFAPAGNGDRMRVLQVNFPNAASLQADSPADNIVIARNTIRNACVYTCFSLAQRVDNVSITRNDVEVDAGNIVQLRQEWISGRIQIDHNRFVATGGAAVVVDSTATAGTDLTRVTLTRNSITAGGVSNGRTQTLAAPCNWWGQASGPTAGPPAQNTGPVTAADPLATTNLDPMCPVPPIGVPDFNPVNPARVFDTRVGSATYLRVVPLLKVGPGVPLEVKFTDLPGGLVPASGVGAVSINVTSTQSTGDGFITVSPCGSTNVVSNVNFQAGRDRANAVLTPVPASGLVCFTSSAATDIVVDVNGWFKAPPGFHPVDPTRVFDTRPGTPAALRVVPTLPVTPGKRLEVKLTDLPGGLVPASGVGAVSINVTSTRSLADGFVTVSPCTTDDAISNVNFQASDDVANLVLTPVSAAGTVCFATSASTDLVVDVNGWFAAPSGFTPVNPTRVADTRPGTPPALRDVPKGRVGPGSPALEVKLTDLPGALVPASGVGAVSITVTSARSLADGFLTVSPCGVNNVVSNVNFQTARDRANAVLTPVSATGTVCINASQPTDVVIDVNGWFANTPTP